MELFFSLLIFVGIIIMIISIMKDQTQSNSNSSSTSTPSQSNSRQISSNLNSSSTSIPSQSNSRQISFNSNSSSTSIPQALSLEFSQDLPQLSLELKSKLDLGRKLFTDGLSLYKIGDIETASEIFREASNLMKIIRGYYPNDLQINFYLLETYQGFDYNQAIEQGFKCLEIMDQILSKNSFVEAGLLLTRYDILRKLYKLLIKDNRANEAKPYLIELVKLTSLMLGQKPPPYKNESTYMTMLDLSKEGVIANFFLQGIKEGRNMARNLVISPYITTDSPELSYHFDPSFSSADEEINIFLTHLILSIRG
jgi:tetratricopeptide (TPR) repeat protein